MGWDNDPAVGQQSEQPVAAGGGGWDMDTPVAEAASVAATPAPLKQKPEKAPASQRGVLGGGSVLTGPELQTGAAEAVAHTLSGMIAKPAGDVAGLGAILAHMAGITDKSPVEIQKIVSQALTYEPRTQSGKEMAENNPLALIGKGLSRIADKVAEKIADPNEPAYAPQNMLANAVREGVMQAPVALSALGGKPLAEANAAKQTALDVAKGENAMIDAVRDTSKAAGYVTPPETGLQAAMSGVVGKTRGEKAASAKNEINATQRLGAEVGVVPGRALSSEEFTRINNETGKVYNAVEQAVGPRVQVTNEFADSLRGTLAKIIEEDVAITPELRQPKAIVEGFIKKVMAPDVAKIEGAPGTFQPGIAGTIERAAIEQPGPRIASTIEQAAAETPGLKRYGDVNADAFFSGPGSTTPARVTPVPTGTIPTLPTSWVTNQISQLRKYAKAYYRADKFASGDTRMGLANQLENLLEKNISMVGPQMLDAFRAARTQFAKTYLLDRITNHATGRVNLQKLGSLSESPAYRGVLTGEFKTAADFANTFGRAAQKSTGEAVPRFTVLDGLFVTGALLHGRPGLAAGELAARAGIPWLIERGKLQNKTPSYQVGAIRQATPSLLQSVAAAMNQPRKTEDKMLAKLLRRY